MDLRQILGELHGERERLDQAIAVLEHLALTHKRRRGRPPAWMAELKAKSSTPEIKRKLMREPVADKD